MNCKLKLLSGFLIDAIVYFTPAVTGEDWLWSYDLWSATFELK
ncbi:MAG: hypothetical protein PUA96_08465 [Bacteroidales bacterium]|nr:hypothetical protein [Bacteroidales bacterium]